jgi:dTDP-4-dehydrorhamnose 3,5-epimerase
VDITALDVSGAWLCTPNVWPDDRGMFLEWFRGDLLAEATGRRFDVIQSNHSHSRRGTLRGLHYADVPPGQAKYVYCPRGSILDVVVDLRVGSPTFGHHVAVQLDDVDRRGVFLAEGLGHAFCALSDSADVTYLVSTTYNPGSEHGVNPVDPDLGIDWPMEDEQIVLSPKDAAAPRLLEARADGLLPSYETCVELYAQLAAEA